MPATALRAWGVSESALNLAVTHPNLTLARVTTQERGQYGVVTETGDQPAVLAGKLLYTTDDYAELPAVGDWVLLAGDDQMGVIQQVLPRTSLLVRKVAGSEQRAQLIAANVDTVFICMALNEDYNLRRLERYLAVVWQSDATPVVVLTKADLVGDLPAKLAEVKYIAIGAEVIATSAIESEGFDAVRTHIGEGKTVAFIGSSGVGKSTLVNTLVGQEVLRTSGLRNDGQGRHTTTHREAILLPGGGVLIDTPGMRELGLDTADIGRTFADIDELIEECRFADCSHEREPGCAVRAAIDSGGLDPYRYASYVKLKREAEYSGKSSRERAAMQNQRIFGGKSGMKAARRNFKEKEKNRMGL